MKRDINNYPYEEAALERCADFLARMIEKYGAELELPGDALEQKQSEREEVAQNPS